MNNVIKAAIKILLPFALISTFFMMSNIVYAGEFAKHKLVIQMSTDDPRTQQIALNNAANMIKFYGINDINIEIVAYGPGLGLLTGKSKHASRVESMAMQNIDFSACGNTMSKVEKKTGTRPSLLKGIIEVKAGVARIMVLQEQGYAYVRP
ncbi:hypothetical protein ACFL17_03690 [Pseudomonadota bacterium]